MTKSSENQFQTLQGIYKDFKTAEDVAIDFFSKNSNFETQDGIEDKFKLLIELLFPKSPDGFKSGEQLWQGLKELSSEKQQQSVQTPLPNFLAQKIRFYYYDPKNDVLSQEIRDFYIKAGRPSAYNYFEGNTFVNNIASSDNSTNLNSSVDEPKKGKTLADIVRDSVPRGSEEQLKSKLTLVLVDTPAIDIKLRNTDTVSIFMNYMPSIMVSQMVPYLGADFCFERNVVENNNSNSRTMTSMSQLKFLLGSQELQPGTVDYGMYNALSKRRQKLMMQSNIDPAELLRRKSLQTGKPISGNVTNQTEQTIIRTEYSETISTGMELFTMPQTLINMDYDQTTTPRYNPVINSTVPFGTIVNATFNVTPSVGLFSFKTAMLTLKIFDRSRLVEIADFLNPKLYQKTTVWLTYGWRSPSQRLEDQEINYYSELINNYMLKREAYGVRNSSISMETDGTATITLSLFTKGASELNSVSPIAETYDIESSLEEYNNTLAQIKELAEKIGLGNFTSGAKDIRGSQVIAAALGGRTPDLDKKTLDKELILLENALKNNSSPPNVTEFFNKIQAAYNIPKGSSKNQALTNLEAEVKRAAASRFSPLKRSKIDFFASMNKDKFKEDSQQNISHPLTKLFENKRFTENLDAKTRKQSEYPRDISFAKLFTTYFSSAVLTVGESSPSIDEYQIVFYNLNEFAGLVANVNIGDFPIDVDELQKAYVERVIQQKGENISLVNFLEIVRDSQFSNPRHVAYGNSDLYDEDGKLKSNSDQELLKRQVQNAGLSKSFTPPAIDFYIETANVSTNGTSSKDFHDLLTNFEIAATTQASGRVKSSADSKVLRIHIYDKAATPHSTASSLFRDKEENFIEVNDSWQKKFRSDEKKRYLEEFANQPKTPMRKKEQAAAEAQSKNSRQEIVDRKVEEIKKRNITNLGFGSGGDPQIRFEKIKREVSKLVPTIYIGSNGTTIKNATYSTNQDSLLSTIMMLRNTTSDRSLAQKNGSSAFDLPLRIISGQLSLTTLGCPMLEHMQQYFIDFNTGTTIDALYNITTLTHNISPGSFTSEIKFTFADGYGRFEGANSFENNLRNVVEKISASAQEAAKIESRQLSSPDGRKKT